MPVQDILLALGGEVRRVTQPLEAALESPAAFAALMEEFGWVEDPAAIDITDVADVIDIAGDVNTVAGLVAQIASSSFADVPLSTYESLLQALRDIVSSLRGLATSSPPTGISGAAWSGFASELLQGLVARYLETHHAPLYAALLVTGVVEEEAVDVGTAPGRVDYTRRTLEWDRLGTAVTEPVQALKDFAAWGDTTGGFDHAALVARLARVLSLAGITAETAVPPTDLLDDYYSATNPARAAVRELLVTLVSTETSGGGTFSAALAVLPIPSGGPSAPPAGYLLTPDIQLTGTGGAPAEAFWPYSVTLVSEFQTDRAIRVEVLPGGVTGSVTSAAATVNASVTLASGEYPFLLLGTWFSHHLRADGWTATLRVTGSPADPELALELSFQELRLVIDQSDFDGFLAEIVGSIPAEIDLEAALTWSSRTGFGINGQVGLAVDVPLNLTIGGLQLTTLTVETAASTAGLELTLGATGSLTLGPVSMSVENMGMRLLLAPVGAAEPAGLLGDLDVELGFKPPDGVGIAIDAGVVTGGGYLFLDADKGEYAGAVQLEFSGIALSAIGLLSTRLPDGSAGYSLLVIVAGEFTPIQLGWGFTLNGVGGLLGVHRSVAVEVLQAGVKAGTLDSVLFPEDVVANAPRIISDLRSAFPPTEDQYVFGPMAILGWGTPTLVSVELGLLLELSTPVRLVIIGQLRVVLPTEEAALVQIRLDVLGVIDFDAQTASVDASLIDSRVGTFTITGDFAMRAAWGSSPNFALSAGGLHPRYTPPAGFPSLSRLAIALSSGDNPRLRLEAYLALTSNTAQVGARVDLYASALGFSVEGELGFDALFQFSPFQFVVDVYAGVALKRGDTYLMGVDLDFTLSGPSPWRARGEATFKVLGFSKSVSFNATFGSADQPALPSTSVWPELQAALADVRSWSAQLPAGGTTLVTLRDTGTTGVVLAHPLGTVSVRQRVAPLDQTLEKFGNTTPTGENRFTVAEARLGGVVVDTDDVTEDFAPAQFFEMTDDEKLSSPSFQQMNAGVSLGGDALEAGTALEAPLEYETRVLDRRENRLLVLDRYLLRSEVMFASAFAGAAALSPMLNTGAVKYRGPDRGVALEELPYVIASTDDLSVAAVPGLDVAGSHATAVAALRTHLAANPGDVGRFQVVTLAEASL